MSEDQRLTPELRAMLDEILGPVPEGAEELHFWMPSEDTAGCPCVKAGCGLVKQASPDCATHNDGTRLLMGHFGYECPGLGES